MAEFENTKQNEDNNTNVNSNEEDITLSTSNQETVTANDLKPKTNMFAWKISVVVLIGVIAYVYSSVDVEIAQTPETTLIEPIVVDERLYACNEVMSGEPSDSLDTCLSAAKDGKELAMMRLIWAYARSNEHQNWTEVFTWLKALPRKDENTQLLMYAIVHFMASSEALKKDSETGISRLVAKNYPPANVFLAAIYALEENVLPPTSNIQWLLEREANEEFNAISATQLLVLYANGFVGKVDIEKASGYLKEAVKRNYPVNANNIAWFLSTLETNPFTTQEFILSLARQFTDEPEYSQNPIYVDTLAATLASNGMFEDAVETQKRAIELLNEFEMSEQQKNANRVDFESRLSLYTNGNALVEDTISIDKTTFFKQMKTSTVDFLFRKFFVLIDVPKTVDADTSVIENGANVDENATY